MTRPVEHAYDDFMRFDALGRRHRRDIVADGPVQVDDAFGIAGTHGQLVHIDVGRIEQPAFLRDGQHGQCIRPGLGGDGGALQRVERNVDPWPLADRAADLLADIEHWRFVAFAFADHDGAVHVKIVEGQPHGFDRGGVGGFFVTAPDQPGSGDRCCFGHADHLQNQHPVQIRACLFHHILFSSLSPSR